MSVYDIPNASIATDEKQRFLNSRLHLLEFNNLEQNKKLIVIVQSHLVHFMSLILLYYYIIHFSFI